MSGVTLNLADLSVDQKIVELVKAANAAITKAEELEATQQKQASAIQAAIPAVVETLVEHKKISESRREKVANALQNPVEALGLLQKLASLRQTQEDAGIGQPEQVKAASASSRRSQTSAADAKLFADLGITLN